MERNPDIEIIDPAEISARAGGTAASGTAASGTAASGKRRGRKPGSANAPKSAPLLADWKGLVCQLHALAAWRSDIPELALDDGSAEKLVNAVSRVMRHYPVTVSEKAADHAYLVTTLLMIYGPIIFLIINKRRNKTEKKNDEVVSEQSNVTPISDAISGQNFFSAQ